jgi:molybdopterin/thiamine biosynthesis adenylyltransferase
VSMGQDDAQRYSRLLLFWGEQTQARIGEGVLLIAGVGGLGATVSQILARAGVGRLHLVDDGVVAGSDLQGWKNKATKKGGTSKVPPLFMRAL